MTLGQERERFTLMLGKLIVWANDQGYRPRIGAVLEQSGHKEGSNHYIGLAADIPVFKPGETTQDMDAHKRMHDCWDTLGGAPRIDHDMNHYSLKYQGRW
jgi:hypothetical protein